MNYIKPVSIKIASFVWMRLWWDNYLFDLYHYEHNCELPAQWVWRDNSQVHNNIAAKTISNLFSNVTCECLVMDKYMLKSQQPFSHPKSLVSRVPFTLESFLIQPQSLSFTLYYDHGHPRAVTQTNVQRLTYESTLTLETRQADGKELNDWY